MNQSYRFELLLFARFPGRCFGFGFCRFHLLGFARLGRFGHLRLLDNFLGFDRRFLLLSCLLHFLHGDFLSFLRGFRHFLGLGGFLGFGSGFGWLLTLTGAGLGFLWLLGVLGFGQFEGARGSDALGVAQKPAGHQALQGEFDLGVGVVSHLVVVLHVLLDGLTRRAAAAPVGLRWPL